MGSSSQLIGMNVGAGSPGRVWPKEKFASLARHLISELQSAVVLFSGPQDGDFSLQIAASINHPHCAVASQFSLRIVAALISQCHLLVSNDTGPMHLGPAVGVPTLGLFSLGHPRHYHPLGESSRFIKKQPIESLEVSEVFSMIKEMLNSALEIRNSRVL
jgi:ADP-heptose:LPS heptosyltransferase